MEFILPLLLFAAMYFLLIRPQQARARAQRQLVTSLSAGDRVVTAGGMIGTIRVLTDHELTVEVAPGVELKVLRVAVSRRYDDEPTLEEEPLEPEPRQDDDGR